MTNDAPVERTHALRRAAAVAGAAAVLSLFTVTPVRTATGESAVLEWNRYAVAAGLAINQGPLPQLRSMAIVHVAMNDAVQAITGGVDTYLPVGDAPAGATASAAAIAAAHFALNALYPADDFDDELAASLVTHGINAGDPGLNVGRDIAAALLAVRATDGASVAQFPYSAPGAGTPGVWVIANPANAALPGWGAVTPWVLQSGSQFRPDAPVALSSGRYARDFNELKDYGGIGPTLRDATQTNIARFWLATPTALVNPLARQVIEARQLDLSATARTLALMYMAGHDASIACWEAKYTYNFWRPASAFANALLDGNDATDPVPGWAPFLGTPAHPEYVSGHSTASGAVNTVLALLFGDEPGITLLGTSPTNVGFERQWTSFSEAVDEVIDARVYGGFHYRTSDEVGARLGRQVAKFVVQHALRTQNGSGEPALGVAFGLTK